MLNLSQGERRPVCRDTAGAGMMAARHKKEHPHGAA